MGALWGVLADGGFEEPVEDDWKPTYPVPRSPPEKEVKDVLSSKPNMLSLIRANMVTYLLIACFLFVFSFALRSMLPFL
ncbi:MAG: hypothetical protein WED05_01300 [Candidatus Atabeyarchaeum deiterrae]